MLSGNWLSIPYTSYTYNTKNSDIFSEKKKYAWESYFYYISFSKKIFTHYVCGTSYVLKKVIEFCFTTFT